MSDSLTALRTVIRPVVLTFERLKQLPSSTSFSKQSFQDNTSRMTPTTRIPAHTVGASDPKAFTTSAAASRHSFPSQPHSLCWQPD